jgi:hypothetical protein
VIHDSRYWKVPLLRIATWLEQLRFKNDTREKSLARVERDIFIGFYSIRKLMATFKVSDLTRQLLVILKTYPIIPGEVADYFNRH